MSILLLGVGAAVCVAGAVMVAFGIPSNEFNFGNTLIVSGTVAIVGGMIVIGLGVAVSLLQRIADSLGTRTAVRSSRPLEMFDSAAGARGSAAPARVPFPPKIKAEPKADAGRRDLYPAEQHFEPPQPVAAALQDYQFDAPALPNPDEAPVTVEDEVSLSPRHPMAPAARGPSGFEPPVRRPPPMPRADEPDAEEPHEMPLPRDAGRREPSSIGLPPRKPQNTYFDAMWPTDRKTVESKPAEMKPVQPEPADDHAAEPVFNWPRRDAAVEPATPAEPTEPAAQSYDDEPRTVAILKSGVVDGMGYTLYVDGSIEAELPQGTLRFASINELRSHLEKTS